MKTPFKISFRQELDETPNNAVLKNFWLSFKDSYCDKLFYKSKNEITIENYFFRLKPDFNFNLWVGIGNARLRIIEKDELRLVKYTVDFTRLTLIYLVFIFFGLFFMIIGSGDVLLSVYLTSYFWIFVILMHGISIFRHWSFFKRILKYESAYVGNYDWDTILKKKTYSELLGMKNETNQLPDAVIRLIDTEIKSRKLDVDNNAT